LQTIANIAKIIILDKPWSWARVTVLGKYVRGLLQGVKMRNFVWVLGCVLVISMVVSPLAVADTTNVTVNNNHGKLIHFDLDSRKSVSSFGNFAYAITGIGKEAKTGITTLTFKLTDKRPVPLTQLMAKLDGWSSDFAIHFCRAGGTSCAFYTAVTPNGPTSVPEPPVTALLACSALVCGGFVRRYL
jgi:hypothetical protein